MPPGVSSGKMLSRPPRRGCPGRRRWGWRAGDVASMMPTYTRLAMAVAREAVVELLPTPPLPDMMA